MFQPELETLPRPKLTLLQSQRLREQVAYVYERVPFYKQAFDERGLKPSDIRGIEDLPKLPFTKKKDLRDTYPFGLFAVPRHELARIHASSGTTGKPTVVGYTRGDLEIFAEVVARSLAAAGGRPGMMLHNAYGYGLFTGGLGLHGGAEKLGMIVVPISGGMTDRQIMLIQDFKPEMISCTPSYAQTLAEEFKNRGVSPEEISLQYAILGAEPWTEAIRQNVDAGLGVKATNIYGLSEIIGPGVANEDVGEREGLSYIWEDHFYPEVVDPETGEPLPEGEIGVLVLTTLTKKAMPILRYWTGDLTYLTREPGASGRTHARMAQIRGRTDDMLI
ncbi:MAG: AMP-binding protein, partial [Meiothermus sp.]